MFLRSVLLAAALLLPWGAAAQVTGSVPRSEVPNAQIIGGASNRLVTTTPADVLVTSTGSSTARTLGDRFSEVFNIKDGWGGIAGAKMDARYETATVSITSGTTALTVGSPLFTAADVGKTIVVKGAKTPSTVGEIVTVAVNSPGTGYTSIPTATASGGGGAGATFNVNMLVVSATVNAAGSGCTDGSQVLTLVGGITPATLNVTVTGGAVASVDSVANGGVYDEMPVLTAAVADGAGCVGVTLDIAMGVDTIGVIDGGSAYTVSGTTVSLSTSGSSVQAGVGTVTVAPDTTPLVTTIAAYVSGTAVTLTDAATATVSAVSQKLLWGSDDLPAINAAITAANARPTGGVVYIPQGNVLVNVYSGNTIFPKSNVTIRGAGLGVTNIICQDFVAGAQGCVSNWGGSPTRYQPIKNVEFRDITFLGLNELSTLVGRPAFKVSNFAHVRFKSVQMNYIRTVAALLVGGNDFYGEDIHIYRSTSGGLSVQDTSSVVVNGCVMRAINDDSLSMHSNNGWPSTSTATFAEPFAFADTGTAVRSSVTISNCDITEGAGISVLGAKLLTVTNVSMRRIPVHGIIFIPSCTASTPQGCTPNFAVNISNVTILDPMQRPEPSPKSRANVCLYINGGPKGADGVLPSYGTNGGALYENNTVASTTTPGGGYVNISNFTCMRTLPAVAAWADWNVGESFWVGGNGGGVPYTGAVTEANLSPSDTIYIQGALRETIISNCIINTGGLRAIRIRQTGLTSMSHDGVDIRDCRFVNYKNAGIQMGSSTAIHQRLTIRGNHFDADPTFTSANRGANGTWLRIAYPMGVYARNVSGLVIERNHFRNVAAPIINTGGLSFLRDNVVFGQAAATGFSTSNVGVGFINANGREWTTIEEDSNPNSATYGSLLSGNYDSASAIPSSGRWVIGRFIWNTAPAVASSKVLLGWSRLTTGTGNTSGTDWTPVYPGTVP